jgi:hypothetical protein
MRDATPALLRLLDSLMMVLISKLSIAHTIMKSCSLLQFRFLSTTRRNPYQTACTFSCKRFKFRLEIDRGSWHSPLIARQTLHVWLARTTKEIRPLVDAIDSNFIIRVSKSSKLLPAVCIVMHALENPEADPSNVVHYFV